MAQRAFTSNNDKKNILSSIFGGLTKKGAPSTSINANAGTETAFADKTLAQKAAETGIQGDWQTPAESKPFDPHKKFGIDRGLFRAIVIGLSLFIGTVIYIKLAPSPIPSDIERRNMHFFARLNADPTVHVTYSGLMYKIIDEPHVDSEELHYLSTPDPDKHVVKIRYQSKQMNGDVFDDTFSTDPSVVGVDTQAGIGVGVESTKGHIAAVVSARNHDDDDDDEDGFEFPSKSLISGLHQGLQKMTRDSIFEFFIPPHLAYGERGSLPLIEPHAPIIVTVKLIDFWKDTGLNKPRKFKLVR